SKSMVETKDDLPPDGKTLSDMPSRTDKLLAFLDREDVDFFGRLGKKNPVIFEPFASGLSGDSIYYADGRYWTKEERAEYEDKVKAKQPLPVAFEWLLPTAHRDLLLKPNTGPGPVPEAPDLTEDETARIAKALDKLNDADKVLLYDQTIEEDVRRNFEKQKA